jgi:integrase
MARRDTRKLTDGDLRRWIAAKTPLAKSDGDGLTFTLSSNGTAAWVLRYRYGGRPREVTIGRYPDFGLAKARSAAAELRVRIEKGDDVATAKQRGKAEAADAWTVKQLVRDYEAKIVPGLADSTAFAMMNYVRTDILPALGSRIAREVTDDDAQHLLESVAERSYWAASNVRKAGAAVFRHGRKRRIVTSNPFLAVEMDTVAAKPRKRDRVALKGPELAVFLKSFDRMDVRDRSLVELLVLTGVRIGEALSAEWVDIDLDAAEWRIPRDKIKTRKRMRNDSFVIPLPPAAVEAFKRQRELSAQSQWVFPALNRLNDTQSMDHERALQRLKAFVATLEKGFPKVTFHDLRSTMRSGLTALGVRVEVAERCLNHQLGGLVGVYDVGDLYEERKLALAQWATHLDTLKAGGNVVALKRRANESGASR